MDEKQRESRSGGGTEARITLRAEIGSIPVVTDWINEKLEAAGCPMKAMTQIDIAADEIVTNIASYAYGPEGGSFTAEIGIDEETKTAEIRFRDRGVPFDPTGKADPDVTLSAEERGIGGLGIFLVKKTMDGMEYRRDEGENVLILRKKIL